MTPQDLHSELNRFDSKLPLEAALTPPSSWYLDARFFALESRTVFHHHWQYIGLTDQIPNEGDYVTGKFMHQPWVLIRGKDKKVRAFYNVCRHHAACVASGAGNTRQLTCPYHGWTYELDGTLRKAPKTDGIRDFDPKEYGLVPLQIEELGRFVFAHFGRPEKSVEESYPGILARLEEMNSSSLHFVKRVTYLLDCNWKVFVDNYLDGGYHVSQLHQDLASELDLSSYRTEIFDLYSIQSCHSGQRASKRLQGGALYAWLYPNVMINRYGNMMDVNWVIPRTENTCEVIFDYFFDTVEGESAKKAIELALKNSDQVQKEDMDISRSVQTGLGSAAYDQGRYSPVFEAPALHFHHLLKKDYSREI